MLKENQRIFNVTMVVLDACICLISMVLAFVIRFNVLDGGHDRIGIVYYLRLMVLVIPFYFYCINILACTIPSEAKRLCRRSEKLFRRIWLVRSLSLCWSSF